MRSVRTAAYNWRQIEKTFQGSLGIWVGLSSRQEFGGGKFCLGCLGFQDFFSYLFVHESWKISQQDSKFVEDVKKSKNFTACAYFTQHFVENFLEIVEVELLLVLLGCYFNWFSWRNILKSLKKYCRDSSSKTNGKPEKCFIYKVNKINFRNRLISTEFAF